MKSIKLNLVFLLVIIMSACSNNDNLATDNDDAQSTLTNNKELVKKFYQEFFGDLNIQSIHNYIGDVYIQHNPYLADGKQALIDGATEWFKYDTPHQIDFQKVMAQDNLVFLHIKSTDGKTSTMDVFRIENNLIVEHWDVSQVIPANPANDHPMF